MGGKIRDKKTIFHNSIFCAWKIRKDIILEHFKQTFSNTVENLITPVKRIALVAKTFLFAQYKENLQQERWSKTDGRKQDRNIFMARGGQKEIQFVPFSPFPFQVKWGEFSRFKVGKKIGSPEEEKKVLLLRNMPKRDCISPRHCSYYPQNGEGKCMSHRHLLTAKNMED